MKPSVSEAEFDVMVTQTGLPLSAEQKTTLYDAYWMLEAMIARVNTPMPRRERTRAHVHSGGTVMDTILTIAEAVEADRGEEAVAGRADQGLPRPHRKPTTTRCMPSSCRPRSARWLMRVRPRRG